MITGCRATDLAAYAQHLELCPIERSRTDSVVAAVWRWIGNTRSRRGRSVALLPPDVERFNTLFETALKGSALETGDELGILGRS